MKKTTLIGAATLFAAALLTGCASDNSAVAENGQKAACTDKASGCCSNKAAEAKVGTTCTSGEAKATGCCSGTGAAAQVK